jgi:hypothetical protein
MSNAYDLIIVRFFLNPLTFIDLSVQAEGDWYVQVGLDPNYNMGRITWMDFDLLMAFAGNLSIEELTAEVYFCWEVDPIDPDNRKRTEDANARWTRQYAVHIEPVDFGVPAGGDVYRAVSYRIYLGDRRDRWKNPRGGVLRHAKTINSSEPVLVTREEKGKTISEKMIVADIEKNSDLIAMCLVAMGLAKYEKGIDDFGQPTIDPIRMWHVMDPAMETAAVWKYPVLIDEWVDTLPVKRDLKWYWTHAPTALGKLLEELGMVFAFDPGGETIRIYRMSHGMSWSEQGNAGVQMIGAMNVPAMDRRGRTVVFTSAPMRARRRFKAKGPKKSTDGKPRISLVEWDGPDAIWVEHDQAIVPGKEKTIADYEPWINYAMADDGMLFRLAYGDITTLYRSIAFVNDVGGRLIPETIKVKAKIAYHSGQGGYVNATEIVDVPVVKVEYTDRTIDKKPMTVIHVKTPLVKVNADGDALYTGARNIADGDIEVEAEIEVESISDDVIESSAAYFDTGFMMADGGVVRKLSTEEVETALTDPETILVRDDKVLLYTVAAGEDPAAAEAKVREKLETERQAMASRWLKGSGEAPQVQRAVGYIPAKLTGRVVRIEYSQEQLMTAVTQDLWHIPDGSMTLAKYQKQDEEFAGQISTAAVAHEQGLAVSGWTSRVVNAGGGDAMGGGGSDWVWVVITGNAAGGEKYFGYLLGDVAADHTITAAGNVSLDDIGATPAVEDREAVVVLNTKDVETGYATAASHVIAAGMRVMGLMTQNKDDTGRRVVLVSSYGRASSPWQVIGAGSGKLASWGYVRTTS